MCIDELEDWRKNQPVAAPSVSRETSATLCGKAVEHHLRNYKFGYIFCRLADGHKGECNPIPLQPEAAPLSGEGGEPLEQIQSLLQSADELLLWASKHNWNDLCEELTMKIAWFRNSGLKMLQAKESHEQK